MKAIMFFSLFLCLPLIIGKKLMDSYESHISQKVQVHLSKHPNIQVGIIIGGTTDRTQPLDLEANKAFKDLCRKKSIEYANSVLEAL